MADSMPVLVAPDAFGPALRAPAVAAAIGRGLERAGAGVADLCPVAGGGPGTLEILLPALGGETAGATVLDPQGREIAAGFGLVDDGGTAIVEAAQVGSAASGGSSFGVGQLVAAAIDAGAAVVVLACGGAPGDDGGAGAVAAIEQAGGLRGATLVALGDGRLSSQRGGGGLAGRLSAQLGARVVAGAGFVLDELDFNERMRAARAVVVGEARLDRSALDGRVSGEVAFRARQAGVPCHAVAAAIAIEALDLRILDLQGLVEAATVAELEAAGERLAGFL